MAVLESVSAFQALATIMHPVSAASTVKGYLFKNSGFSDALQRLSKAAASAS